MATFGCMPSMRLATAFGFAVLAASFELEATPVPQGAPPAMVIGQFQDDYGGRHTIDAKVWQHGTRAKYHILRWNAEGQYLIAHNDPANPSEKDLYTRIDWMPLEMAPYSWAFCMTAYAAPTADSAEKTVAAKRDEPRKGCNGFPFSRMKQSAP